MSGQIKDDFSEKYFVRTNCLFEPESRQSRARFACLAADACNRLALISPASHVKTRLFTVNLVDPQADAHAD
ncbi:hypothetical protein F3J24_24540 [Comamonas sp. Tr-654]|uniref:hypothetical protein n=1 Tax=Comamonas sp. Tr-654 TaxID=2608341 RepID=UPI001420A673|nr:hypothetical protein [Comamonas sp. Tr-654]NIF86643.1 hypothetical protein [Comamonas sp. Tr-654]